MYALQASRNSPLLSSVLMHGLGCKGGVLEDLGSAMHGMKKTKAGEVGVEGLLRTMTLEGGIKE